MKNFFSAVQGKFDAKYHGRYVGNILEQIASVRKEIVEPLLNTAPTKNRWTLKAVQEVTTEYAYLTDESREQDRLADLEITLESGETVGSLLVEIKVKDGFLPGQLDAYIKWAKGRSESEDRAVVVLTAFPIGSDENTKIKENSEFIKHIYLSEFMDALRPKVAQSELIALFSDYLYEEGYAMYQLQTKNQGNDGVNETDYDALLSFMVLTFLPHTSGKGRVASAKKIAHGPAVFSNIIQNWQLVSDRFSAVCLENKRRPTIRYFPEQGTNSSKENFMELSDENILTERKKTRSNKTRGRYWLTSDNVLDGDMKLRLEWGQIIQIQRGNDDEFESIECFLFVCLRQGQNQIGGKISKMTNGIKDQRLYNIESFMKEIVALAQKTKNQAIQHAPELENILKLK